MRFLPFNKRNPTPAFIKKPLHNPLKTYQDRITHCKSVWNTILTQRLLSRQRDLISETRINHLQWQLHDIEWDLTWRQNQNSQARHPFQKKFAWVGRLFCFLNGAKEKDPLNEKSLALVKTFDDFLLELKMNLRTEEVGVRTRNVGVQVLVPPPRPSRVPSPVHTPSPPPPSPALTPPPVPVKDNPVRKEIKIIKVLRPERSLESDFLTPRTAPSPPASKVLKIEGGGESKEEEGKEKFGQERICENESEKNPGVSATVYKSCTFFDILVPEIRGSRTDTSTITSPNISASSSPLLAITELITMAPTFHDQRMSNELMALLCRLRDPKVQEAIEADPSFASQRHKRLLVKQLEATRLFLRLGVEGV
ncbi:hypothetical protein BDZ45DRAFT_748726 [Acephala macrosclerotiorum]|nr:hypothetical protein BDZ45DRAFT_748726 [Acephala macrosclerotiorum]